MSRKVD
jgi:hypothetical protein